MKVEIFTIYWFKLLQQFESPIRSGRWVIRTPFANSPNNSIATSGNLAAFPPNKTIGCLASLDFMLVVLVLAVGIGAFTRNPGISGHIDDKLA